TNAIDRHAKYERTNDDPPRDPRTPAQGTRGARKPLVVLADPFQREPCAAGNEGCGIRLFAPHLGGRAARPGAIGVGPDCLRVVARLESTHGGNLKGSVLVHRECEFYAEVLHRRGTG